jgi:UDP-GlcNAc:undecaprenyl-phosphate GlcNAc-1-phosphate transferase
LSFALACISLFFYQQVFPREITGIIIASFVMLAFGVIDDRGELSISAKFLMQIIATVVLIHFGVKTQIVYIGDALNILVTFIWVLGVTNAFNHLDVADGVAAGIALIVGLAFSAVSLLNHEVNAAILSLGISGAIAGFLIYNLPSAGIYMGNAGSHFLGFFFSALALMISYAPLDRKVALLTPLLILGVPIFDTAFLIIMRLYKKKIPFKKSNDHLPMRFKALGYSKWRVLAAMLAWGVSFSVSGVVVSQVSNAAGVIVVCAQAAATLFLLKIMSKVQIDG